VEVEGVGLVVGEGMNNAVPLASSHTSLHCTLPSIVVAVGSMGSTSELALAQPTDRVLAER
jgi:hypothetical protein